MADLAYSVLVRTFNSEAALPTTLESLARQTIPPSKYVVVDSGSTDATVSLLPAGSVVHQFAGGEFNYSEALNQGLSYVSTTYVMIVSSHTSLRDCRAVEYALKLLASDPTMGAAYFCGEETSELTHSVIDRDNFDGFNGLWNTCSIIKVAFLKKRRFRPDVFAAEDQEWAKWLLYCQGKSVARIRGAGMDHVSRNVNIRRFGQNKRVNEYVSIAFFVRRELLGYRNVCRIALGAFKPALFRPIEERLFCLVLAYRLVKCRFAMPRYSSRYFSGT